jgi:hypothetical protein
MQEYDKLKVGKIKNWVQPLAESLYRDLCDAIEILERMPEHKAYTSKYMEYVDGSDMIRHTLPLQEIRDFDAAKEEYDTAAKTELWGQVPLLGQIFKVIKEGKAHQLKLMANVRSRNVSPIDVITTNIAVGEWEAVRDGKIPQMINGSPRAIPMLFDIKKIKPIAERLHIYILTKYADYEKSELAKNTKKKMTLSEGLMHGNPQTKALYGMKLDANLDVLDDIIQNRTLPSVIDTMTAEANSMVDALSGSITSAIKIVDQQYHSFVDLQEPWSFFHGLADYVKTIEDMVPTKGIIEVLEGQRQIAEQAYKAIDAKAFKELQVAAEEITKTIQASSIQFEPIAQAIKSIQDQLSGATWSTDPLHYLDMKLFEIARGLKEIGYPEIVRPFENENKKVKNIYGNYTFSEAYYKVSEEKSKLEKRKQIEPWGAWEKMPLVEKAVFEPTEKGDLYAQEMDTIRKGEASEDDIIFFQIKIYKQDAQRLHRFLMAQLTKIENEEKLHPTFKAEIKTPVSNSELKPKKNDKLIKQVNFIERKTASSPVYTFYINDDTTDIRSLRADSFRLKELVKIIRGGNVAFRKDLLDYINSNKDCALYCAGKYKLTRIIEKDGQSFRICTGIKVDVKSETAHKKKMTHRGRA